jgi:UMF1 family MFS transporter
MLWYVAPGGEQDMLFWAVAWFGLGFIGMEFATIFTNALMPSLSDHDELGAISGSGFAFGYLGGLLALILMLLFLAENATTGKTLLGIDPILGLDVEAREGTRAVGPFTAIWYVVFMIPFFLWVKEPKTEARPLNIGAAIGSLIDLLKSLRYRKSLSAYLASSLFYRDALNALYGFGGVYASGVLGWSIIQIGTFGILGAVTAMVASWVGGRADRRYGPKPVIATSILVLMLVCLIIVGMTRESVWGIAMDPASSAPDVLFYICGALIGAAGGTVQAASRTMMVRHTTPERATEAFGLFALSGKVASFLSPALIALATHASGSQRIGISPLIGLFLIGLILLLWVKPRGEQV